MAMFGGGGGGAMGAMQMGMQARGALPGHSRDTPGRALGAGGHVSNVCALRRSRSAARLGRSALPPRLPSIPLPVHFRRACPWAGGCRWAEEWGWEVRQAPTLPFPTGPRSALSPARRPPGTCPDLIRERSRSVRRVGMPQMGMGGGMGMGGELRLQQARKKRRMASPTPPPSPVCRHARRRYGPDGRRNGPDGRRADGRWHGNGRPPCS